MGDCRKEFSTLIKATLHYLQEEWGEHVHLAIKEPPPLPPSKPVIEQKKPEPKPAVEKKREEPKPVSNGPVSNWTLNPMALPPELSPRYTSFFKEIPLHIPIRLVVTDPSQTFFLENVARALTKLIAPAALFSGKLDSLLTNQNIQLVLAPLSHLKKRFPQVELHQFLKLDGPTLLPLADHYDIELKHALWNTLKSFQNTPPSS